MAKEARARAIKLARLRIGRVVRVVIHPGELEAWARQTRRPVDDEARFNFAEINWRRVRVDVCSYPPLAAQLILNGHEWVERQARRNRGRLSQRRQLLYRTCRPSSGCFGAAIPLGTCVCRVLPARRHSGGCQYQSGAPGVTATLQKKDPKLEGAGLGSENVRLRRETPCATISSNIKKTQHRPANCKGCHKSQRVRRVRASYLA
jgi:hypothetical protein